MRKIWLKMYLPNYGLILRRGKIMMEKKGIYTLWQKMLHLILSSTKDWKMIIGRNK